MRTMRVVWIACTQRRGVSRVTRSHGVRCVKWSTISLSSLLLSLSLPVIICILSLHRYLAYRAAEPARRGCIEHIRAVHRWHTVYRRDTTTGSYLPVSRTHAESAVRIDGVTIPGCAACVSIVHPSTASSSSPSSCPARVTRYPARTTDPSFRSACLMPSGRRHPHRDRHRSSRSILGARAYTDVIFEGGISDADAYVRSKGILLSAL